LSRGVELPPVRLFGFWAGVRGCEGATTGGLRHRWGFCNLIVGGCLFFVLLTRGGGLNPQNKKTKGFLFLWENQFCCGKGPRDVFFLYPPPNGEVGEDCWQPPRAPDTCRPTSRALTRCYNAVLYSAAVCHIDRIDCSGCGQTSRAGKYSRRDTLFSSRIARDGLAGGAGYFFFQASFLAGNTYRFLVPFTIAAMQRNVGCSVGLLVPVIGQGSFLPARYPDSCCEAGRRAERENRPSKARGRRTKAGGRGALSGPGARAAALVS